MLLRSTPSRASALRTVFHAQRLLKRRFPRAIYICVLHDDCVKHVCQFASNFSPVELDPIYSVVGEILYDEEQRLDRAARRGRCLPLKGGADWSAIADVTQCVVSFLDPVTPWSAGRQLVAVRHAVRAIRAGTEAIALRCFEVAVARECALLLCEKSYAAILESVNVPRRVARGWLVRGAYLA